MRISPTLDLIMSIAAQEAAAGEFEEIEPEHLLMAVLKFSELQAQLFADMVPDPRLVAMLRRELEELVELVQRLNQNPTALRRAVRKGLGRGGRPFEGGEMHRSAAAKDVFALAGQLAVEEGSDFLTTSHLLLAVLKRPTPLIEKLVRPNPFIDKTPAKAAEKPGDRQPRQDDEATRRTVPPGLTGVGQLTQAMTDLRRRLQAVVLGQDNAIEAFIEGVFNAEVVAAVDEGRRRPEAVFVFAGPPGVGKTLLAETGAEALGRPFKRFDMSAYAGFDESHSLVGTHPSFKGAHPGALTEFVKKNPDAILLFDEIEKANLNTVQLFLQVLDAGRLEDKFTEEPVEFAGTMIILTTNAGRALYDDPNASGIHSSRSNWHRKTIISALETEIDQRTGQPFFPAALCSRLATGYPVVFNHLGLFEMERIATARLQAVCGLLERQLLKKVEFDTRLPLCLIMREGVKADARAVCAQVENFIKSEVFKLSRLFRAGRLEEALAGKERLLVEPDPNEMLPPEIADLVSPAQKPGVLLIAEEHLFDLWRESLPDFHWHYAGQLPDVTHMLDHEEVDLVLLDIWIGESLLPGSLPDPTKTALQFDHAPAAASSLSRGQEILHGIHGSHPEVPCYLLSFAKASKQELDEELFLACVRSGGARGVVQTAFYSSAADDRDAALSQLRKQVLDAARRIQREKRARELGAEHKVLMFETVPKIDAGEGAVRILLRKFNVARAYAASDVSAVLQEVERPSVTFADVYGADAAKAELRYIVDWLREPRKYRIMGLRPPRGVLLCGSPGTGKTMMARALAGESKSAFILGVATNFITIWQGSGPQNVRDLFERARRYAPSVVFIDEIDAIGKRRVGGAGAGAAAEQTLNALLVEMDGFRASESRPVVVVAATNIAEHLDEALRRRFDREIEVDKPDKSARLAYLKKRLSGSERRRVSNEVLERLAAQTAGYTIADLERVIDLAGRMAASAGGTIDDALIEEALERMRFGEARPGTDRQTLLRVARHEAGHALISWLQGKMPLQVSITARGGVGGLVEGEADEDRLLSTKGELLGTVRRAMGGRAAEILYYGDEEGLSTGASADLRAASRCAELMVGQYGMSEELGPVSIDRDGPMAGALAPRIVRLAARLVRREQERAISELAENRDRLDRLVAELMEKNRLAGDDLRAILPKRE